MVNELVKGSSTPYAGYHYQTHYGVSMLVQWLESPAAYRRAWFECTDKAVSQQGLDDVVLERADGFFDYFQVKYTPPAAKAGCEMTWDWFLEPPSGSANSFFQKWFKAYSKIPAHLLGNATLVTNRTPSREIEEALQSDHLSYDLAPAEIKTKLDAQLGGPDSAKAFLAKLKIDHSQQALTGLEREIRQRLKNLGYSDAGVDRLLVRAPSWAIFKNDPSDSDSITLEVVKDTLSLSHPAPMPQDFEVPDGYEPPDLGFHEYLVKAIADASDRHVVLAGPPGRGKSTYISYLCEELSKLKIPVVRHHYFLSVTDRNDRLTPALISRSLLSQTATVAGGRKGVHVDPNKPEQLGDALASCGQAFAEDKVPFVVVIDGLDHVWRDNTGDVRPLQELFEQILPLPDNVVLVVGTQPVDDDRLPARLLAHVPRKQWLELPTMTPGAVLNYVQRQVLAGRWERPTHPEHGEIQNRAALLHTITGGHPLHLIYSVEALLATTTRPSDSDIQNLPACPHGDIKRYYRELWAKLTYAQRDVLHLMSELRFRWPAQAFRDMSAEAGDRLLSLDGVRHLLFDSGAGLQPFHESLAVFIKEEVEGHDERVETLLPRAEEWLSTKAPELIRNTWHWLVRSDIGDSRPLRTGLTRDWVLDRLVDGYEPTSLVRMLTRAEELAFAERAYGEAFRHRSLKSRVIDGPTYQIGETSGLRRAAWALAVDDAVGKDALVSRQQLPTSVLPWLSIALSERGDKPSGDEAAIYAARRWNHDRKVAFRRSRKEVQEEKTAICEAVIRSRLVKSVEQLAWQIDRLPSPALAKLSSALIQQKDLTAIVELWEHTTSKACRTMLEDAACRLAAFNGAKLQAWDEFNCSTAVPLPAPSHCSVTLGTLDCLRWRCTCGRTSATTTNSRASPIAKLSLTGSSARLQRASTQKVSLIGFLRRR